MRSDASHRQASCQRFAFHGATFVACSTSRFRQRVQLSPPIRTALQLRGAVQQIDPKASVGNGHAPEFCVVPRHPWRQRDPAAAGEDNQQLAVSHSTDSEETDKANNEHKRHRRCARNSVASPNRTPATKR